MIGLLVIALAGAVMGWYFRVGFVIIACLVFLVADIIRIILKSSFQFADILILLAYMSALQGGFMLGAYLKHRRRD
ncbi:MULTISPECIES: hypothetical protein [unclassified Methylobacterium]|uniref:hypothetical protein n=1 Tax=unclassified Methylobacterium TaxID=2615210 RepID=UPI001FBA8E0D|nr:MULTISPECIES: hypothetical protein [unclassified Methylobacterium]MCJ2020297.1 hypothetical protein [Methylobacterium sp. E-065]